MLRRAAVPAARRAARTFSRAATTRALVLEEVKHLQLRDIEVDEPLGPDDVRIAISKVGICGSDVEYYKSGRIGDFVVEAPMILGHEAAGVVTEVGSAVAHLKEGDRVCMEPGIPDPMSRASHLGMYNVDPAVRFWATPPYHGCLRPSVVHPAAYTFPVPDHVSLEEAALVEPLAVGMHACMKASCKPGDIALVIGAGPIGMVTTLCALASGCAEVIIADMQVPKLRAAEGLGPVTGVNVAATDLEAFIIEKTGGWGVDKTFECSGNAAAASKVYDYGCPGGTVIHVGHPTALKIDIVKAQVKELKIECCFRYAHVYPRAINLMSSGAIDVKPLITDRFGFDDSVAAFEFAALGTPESIKAIIDVDPSTS
uniref:Enoyl reductase (ER) domain-containing protein n=1 Tax=Phaeomonas parva TaxID=124430 RepID=A0A7S1TV40_9STRA|mmetsp:Transcript_19300/g.58375  ORF Transcript_19300/g.58375 Transcript_19300/m.58375 type:complete len:370 (+) Transcript_19300:210-1319(+)|eukprot:CAMPEP_0118864816 /NCGR_PEP_ID=MMETSP1163-20130328/9281_1 /TAXON_ID=124430 /ORGANISM="Phaeomonas parva, Strain CCMP2877" /LENGTH=369 /DNA_ID=CAMNT_0006798987 /DNA_START=140 /DNA_END=1249 /DNA_ORIENTATION=+